MPDNTQFDGKGFKDGPIEGTEAAQHRHMFHELDRNYVKVDETLMDTMQNAATIANAFKIISAIIKVGAPLGIVAMASGALAKSWGLL